MLYMKLLLFSFIETAKMWNSSPRLRNKLVSRMYIYTDHQWIPLTKGQ